MEVDLGQLPRLLLPQPPQHVSVVEAADQSQTLLWSVVRLHLTAGALPAVVLVGDLSLQLQQQPRLPATYSGQATSLSSASPSPSLNDAVVEVVGHTHKLASCLTW